MIRVVCLLWLFLPPYFAKVIPKQSFSSTDEDLSEMKHDDIADITSDREYGKVDKKAKKEIPKTIPDYVNTDKSDLVLLQLPPDFMKGGKEKMIRIVEKELAGFLDVDIIRKLADGDTKAIPSAWSLLTSLHFKSAFTAIVAKHFLENYKTVTEHSPIPDISRTECKKECKEKQTQLFQFLNSQFIRGFETPLQGEPDIRIRVLPSPKKYYRYVTKDENHSECICLEVPKNFYVSPMLQEIINEKFFNLDRVEQKIDELQLPDPIIEDDDSKESSNWSLRKFGGMIVHSMGMYTEKTRRNRDYEPKSKHYFFQRAGEKADFLVFHGIVSVILAFTLPCLWPFHFVFVIIAYPFV